MSPGGTAPVLEGRGVSMRFAGLLALDGVHLAVPAAGLVGLVGPNGAGKTTLFGVLSGLLRPTAGEVLIDGSPVTDLSVERRARLGLARTFQHLELFVELTPREHLGLAYRARHRRARLWTDLLAPARRDAAEDELIDLLLDVFGLGPVADRPAGSLPAGTGRLLEVARALATRPRVVLLDEPSSGLDARETDEFASALRWARDRLGVAFVLVEHNIGLVLDLCERVTVLDFGRQLAEGTPEQVRADPLVRSAYLGTALA